MSIKRTLKNKNLSKLQYEYNKSLKKIAIRDKNSESIQIEFFSFLKIKKINHLDNHKKAQVVLEIQNENDNEDIENNFYILDRVLKQTKKELSKRSVEWFSKEMTEDYIEYILNPIYKVTSKMTYLYVYVPQDELFLEKVESLDDGDYIRCKIQLKGLRIYREDIVQEWEFVDIQTEQDYNAQLSMGEWKQEEEDLCNIDESPIEYDGKIDCENVSEETLNSILDETVEEYIEIERGTDKVQISQEEKGEDDLEQENHEKKNLKWEKTEETDKTEETKEREETIESTQEKKKKSKKIEANPNTVIIKKKQKYISIAKR